MILVSLFLQFVSDLIFQGTVLQVLVSSNLILRLFSFVSSIAIWTAMQEVASDSP